MTSSIPDSMSTEALLELMASAVDDTEDTSKSEDKPSMTPSEMKKLVGSTVEELTDKFDTIFGYKLVAMYCITALKMHHDGAALKFMEDGDFQTASAWSRDAGKCQSAWSDVQEIHCGDEDFISNNED
jgi:hypothetical protein